MQALVLAYLDPGTGSMLVQGIVGGVAALSVIIKMSFRRTIAPMLSRVTGIFRRKSGSQS